MYSYGVLGFSLIFFCYKILDPCTVFVHLVYKNKFLMIRYDLSAIVKCEPIDICGRKKVVYVLK